MTTFNVRILHVLEQLRAVDGHTFSENQLFCRVDQTRCTRPELLGHIKTLALEARAEQLGSIQLFGEISGEFDLNTATLADVAGELVGFVFSKIDAPQWWYFLTIDGLSGAFARSEFSTDLPFATAGRVIWFGESFPEFTSRSLEFRNWGGSRIPNSPKPAIARPTMMVRDLAPIKAPIDLSPWLLEDASAGNSAVFDTW